jgi:hypothetical protein
MPSKLVVIGQQTKARPTNPAKEEGRFRLPEAAFLSKLSEP